MNIYNTIIYALKVTGFFARKHCINTRPAKKKLSENIADCRNFCIQTAFLKLLDPETGPGSGEIRTPDRIPGGKLKADPCKPGSEILLDRTE
jgi:hypothetical protein